MWSASNPSFGATFTLHVKEVPKGLKSSRQQKEKELEKEGKDVSYPSFEALKAEELDEDAKFIWIIADANGTEIRRMSSAAQSGMVRQNWNLRKASTNPVGGGGRGPLVVPGTYQLSVVLVHNGNVDTLVAKRNFNVVGLNNQTLVAKDTKALDAFRAEVAELNRKVSGQEKRFEEANQELDLIEKAVLSYPNTNMALLAEIRKLKLIKAQTNEVLYGDGIRAKHEFETVPSLTNRLGMIEYQLAENTTGVSKTHRANLTMVQQQYEALYPQLQDYYKRIAVLQTELEKANIPYTKSRLNWKED